MGTLSILGRKGDTKLSWDTKDKDSIKEAEAAFKLLTDKGHMAYEVKDGGKGEQIKKFNPKAGEIILVPQLRGGC
ncbi:MAG: hypothetical protein KGJ86_18860 [Chloroflexota bacterium]|nr:hypothetical protein [Chloroflexota bacterium]